MAALDSLNFTFVPVRSATAAANKTGTNFKQITNQLDQKVPVAAVSNGFANNAVGGGDQMLQALFSITAAGTTVLDFTTFTDVLSRTGGSFARIKYVEFWLLSTADDATNGTACSSVTCGNTASNQQLLFLGAAAHTFVVKNGDIICYSNRSAAGLTVDGTHKSFLVTNNDGANAAALQITVVGGST